MQAEVRTVFLWNSEEPGKRVSSVASKVLGMIK